jgi:hypothetical protein
VGPCMINACASGGLPRLNAIGCLDTLVGR